MPKMKKWVALFTSLVMLLGMMPLDVMAETASNLLVIKENVDQALLSSGGYTVTFFDEDGTTVLRKFTGVAFNTEVSSLAEQVTVTPPLNMEFAGWRPGNVSYIQQDTQFTASYRTTNLFTLRIYYLFDEAAGGGQASQTHLESLPANYSYSVNSPAVTGYAPDAEAATIAGNTNDWGEGVYLKDYTVYYHAAEGTPYTVEHYTENLAGTYVLEATDDLHATTGSAVSIVPKDYTGFTLTPGSLLTGKVAADGSTVFKLYYSRNSYTYFFESENGSFVPPVTYKYGAAVTAPVAPQRVGYTFTGWFTAITLPPQTAYAFTTMPASDVTLHAGWAGQKVDHTRVYWLQNANDGF